MCFCNRCVGISICFAEYPYHYFLPEEIPRLWEMGAVDFACFFIDDFTVEYIHLLLAHKTGNLLLHSNG